MPQFRSRRRQIHKRFVRRAQRPWGCSATADARRGALLFSARCGNRVWDFSPIILGHGVWGVFRLRKVPHFTLFHGVCLRQLWESKERHANALYPGVWSLERWEPEIWHLQGVDWIELRKMVLSGIYQYDRFNNSFIFMRLMCFAAFPIPCHVISFPSGSNICRIHVLHKQSEANGR